MVPRQNNRPVLIPTLVDTARSVAQVHVDDFLGLLLTGKVSS